MSIVKMEDAKCQKRGKDSGQVERGPEETQTDRQLGAGVEV